MRTELTGVKSRSMDSNETLGIKTAYLFMIKVDKCQKESIRTENSSSAIRIAFTEGNIWL